MNHLTKEQISAWIAGIGERTPEEEQHVLGCEICSAELENIQTTLGLFRTSVRAWAQRAENLAVPAEKTLAAARPRETGQRLRWAALAAVLVLVIVMTLKISAARDRQHQLREQERAHADDVLLRQVDAQISRAVPVSMEPLTSLVSSKESSYEEEGNTEQKSEGKN